MRTRVRLTACLFALLFAAALLPAPGHLHAGALDPALEAALAARPPDASLSVIINLKDQADIPALDRRLKRERASRPARHEQVVRALREVATRTQPALIAHLAAARARGDVTGFTPYWIANLIVAEATKAEILRLADHPDVGIIEENFTVSPIEPVTTGGGHPPRDGIGVTPGLRAIHADRVWYELGYTGAGRLVANLDTGVDSRHRALRERWRGHDPGVKWWQAWFDAAYDTWTYPVDFGMHGTHVMGTITGLGADSADTIGVAWGAHWIACNAIDQPTGPAFDNDIIAAFEWFADPDGDPATIDDVPDVVQNSWGINETFGGGAPPYTDCDDRWWAAIDDAEAAGVVVTWSAGNEGPWYGTLRSPADRATSPYTVFSIGAVDATAYGFPYPIADFSSRGPSGCGGPYEVKPEVVAPGVDVYSSIPGGGYQGGWNGTSMAGPHVAGIVALMREADPDLDVDTIKEVLMATARDLGDPGEENTYGHGFIDAYEAVAVVMNGIGHLQGTVTDAETGEPVGAELELVGTGRTTVADPGTGAYAFLLPGDSTYTVRATHYGHTPQEQRIYVMPVDTTGLDLALSRAPSGDLAGIVMDAATGAAIPGATVEILDAPVAAVTTGPFGTFELPDIPSGTPWRVRADVAGRGRNEETIEVVPDGLTLLALPLAVDLIDDIEGPVDGWTHVAVTPGYGDQWHTSAQRNHTPGGTTAWKCGDTGGGLYADRLDAALVTPEINLGTDERLLFWHWIDAETAGGTEAWDGATVEISIDGGPWQPIAPVDGYPWTIHAMDNPLRQGTPCFSAYHDWRREEFDLSAFTGRARVRFRFGSNNSGGRRGWYVDDVVLAPDPPAPPVSVLTLPESADIEIGPGGGAFAYSMALVNNTDQAQVFDWWTDVSAGGALVYGPIETHTEALAAGESRVERARTQAVPGSAPAGTYRFNVRTGTLPDRTDAISSFPFTKTAGR